MHGPLIGHLLADLARFPETAMHVVLTLNVEETLPFDPASFPFRIDVVRNAQPRGFGANHNAASAHCAARYFAIVNPDVRLPENPFPALLPRLDDASVAAAAPLTILPDGNVQDTARSFPSPWSILAKAAGWRPHPANPSAPFRPDWVAGSFVVFRRDAYRVVGGFDEKYYLYYEDVDICARLAALGWRVEVEPAVKIIHDPRLSSHHDLRYFRVHVQSAIRYFGGRLLWKRAR